MSEPVVTINDVRQCGLCVRGARAWFDANGLDFRHFLDHGYPVSVIEATNDALGLRVAQYVREKGNE